MQHIRTTQGPVRELQVVRALHRKMLFFLLGSVDIGWTVNEEMALVSTEDTFAVVALIGYPSTKMELRASQAEDLKDTCHHMKQ